MRSGVTSLGRVSAMVSEFTAFNLEDGTYSAEEVNAVYGRFLAKLQADFRN